VKEVLVESLGACYSTGGNWFEKRQKKKLLLLSSPSFFLSLLEHTDNFHCKSSPSLG